MREIPRGRLAPDVEGGRWRVWAVGGVGGGGEGGLGMGDALEAVGKERRARQTTTNELPFLEC